MNDTHPQILAESLLRLLAKIKCRFPVESGHVFKKKRKKKIKSPPGQILVKEQNSKDKGKKVSTTASPHLMSLTVLGNCDFKWNDV